MIVNVTFGEFGGEVSTVIRKSPSQNLVLLIDERENSHLR